MNRKIFLISILCLSIISCISWKYGLRDYYKNRPAGIDITHEYNSIFANIDSLFGPAELEELKNFKILFVPGFLSDIFFKMHEYVKNNRNELGEFLNQIGAGKAFQKFLEKNQEIKIGSYFHNQMQWLTDNGFEEGKDFLRVKIESEDGPEENAARIAKTIFESEKPVIILAHSKGGIDSLTALLNYEDTIHKVKGFIPIQTPFWGSPIADAIANNKHVSSAVYKFLRYLEGTEKSLLSLTRTLRESFNEINKQKIAHILTTIPTITFSSWTNHFNTLLIPTFSYMDSEGIKNDGLVPVQSAILPHIEFVKKKNIDHAAPVTQNNAFDFDKIRLTKTLLYMLLTRM